MPLAFKQRPELDRLENFWRAHAAAHGKPASPPTTPNSEPIAHAECAELDPVRGQVNPDAIAAAERGSAATGVGADRILINAGAIDEETYLRRLSEWLGIMFDGLDWTPREQCPLSDDRLIDAAAAGIVPISVAGKLAYVVAPRGLAARRLIQIAKASPDAAKDIRLTSSERLRRFVFRHAGNAIGARATEALLKSQSTMSAAPPRWRNSAWLTLTIIVIACIALIAQPRAVLIAFELMLAVVFLAWIGLRLIGTLIERPRPPARAPIPDHRLPVYTVMIALYREASSVTPLLEALSRLNYPPEKLDIKFIAENDDEDTRAALATAKSRLPFEVIVAPDVGPRTKPKALNAALSFARGTFLVVYDAEDRPEPDQLRRALDAFLADDMTLACVQASLTIDNSEDNWLTALFTAEYAGQFDVFLPALAALNLPLPLGGSSNHFRTATLRKVGGWDPFNVTEDADLGIRIARFGYRTGVINTTTYEEAPARLGPWLRQRTRWFKGWMQTWLVHMREPRRLARELGLPAFIAFQLMVGGNALAALIHPIFIVSFLLDAVRGDIQSQDQLAAAFFGASVAAGYLTSAVLGIIGLIRRRLPGAAWSLLLIPVHWMLLSTAAWRAVLQLIFDPYRWEKTDHGQARTSRLLRRERVKGIVAEIMADASANASALVRNSAASRLPHPRAAV